MEAVCANSTARAAAGAAGGRCRDGQRCRSGRALRGPRAARGSSGRAASMPASRITRSTIFCQRSLSAGKRRTSDRPGLVDAGLGLGDAERELQPAQLVDQPGAAGVDAGEDTAARRGVETAGVELARLADLAREIGVDGVELAADRRRAAPGSAAGRSNTCRHWCRSDRRSTCGRRACRAAPIATGQMPNTPIEPVMVAGCATITSARTAAR